jgi:hypothetical protein
MFHDSRADSFRHTAFRSVGGTAPAETPREHDGVARMITLVLKWTGLLNRNRIVPAREFHARANAAAQNAAATVCRTHGI